MPYPRLWDTGNSIQQNSTYDSNYQDPMDTKGQYTAIVGVGREDAPKIAGNDAVEKHKDERCLLGGWGGTCAAGVCTSEYLRTGLQQMFSGVSQIKLPDPITSWTELKMYQMRTMRYANMSCLGRYEKVFKPGSSENLALMGLGGEWSRVIVQKCKRDNSAPCEYMSLQEYREAGFPTSDLDHYTIPQTKLEGWPLAWRGYMVDGTYKIPAIESPIPTSANQFPNFGSVGGILSGALLKTGMGSAQLGDIVLMPSGASNGSLSGNTSKRGLAKIAIVSEVNLPKASKKPGEKDCVDRNDCYIQVLEADNGKFPDVCGTTSAFGEVKARYLYAPGKLPTPVKEEFQRINAHTMSCEDPNLGRCEFLPWNSVRLYRIREDTYPLRTGCDQENAKDCE
jgi:hypothetical protein